MELHLPVDYEDLLRELLAAEVEFAIVGGWAVAVHGHGRATDDMDIFVAATPANAARVLRALRAFGAPVDQHGVTEGLFAHEQYGYRIGRKPLLIELLTTIDGVTFAEVASGAVSVRVADLVIPCTPANQDLPTFSRRNSTPYDSRHKRLIPRPPPGGRVSGRGQTPHRALRSSRIRSTRSSRHVLHLDSLCLIREQLDQCPPEHPRHRHVPRHRCLADLLRTSTCRRFHDATARPYDSRHKRFIPAYLRAVAFRDEGRPGSSQTPTTGDVDGVSAHRRSRSAAADARAILERFHGCCSCTSQRSAGVGSQQRASRCVTAVACGFTGW